MKVGNLFSSKAIPVETMIAGGIGHGTCLTHK